jgi:hypothetical protein
MRASWRDLDVPKSGACSLHGARPDHPHQGIRTIDAASRLGRRRQFVDIGRAVRPGQSQGALRSQRHRQRRKYPTAPPQSSTAGHLLRVGRPAGAARTPRDAARRLAADHQRAPSSAAKTAGSAAGATRGEQFHGDLPGVLAIKLRFHGERSRKRTGISVTGLPRGTIFSCRTYSKLSSPIMRADTEYCVMKNLPLGQGWRE